MPLVGVVRVTKPFATDVAGDSGNGNQTSCAPKSFWKREPDVECNEELLDVNVGDRVMPGPHWNTIRLGELRNDRRGTVVECKSWGVGGTTRNCVSVQWDGEKEPLIYRWGVIATTGQRRYDVQRVEQE